MNQLIKVFLLLISFTYFAGFFIQCAPAGAEISDEQFLEYLFKNKYTNGKLIKHCTKEEINNAIKQFKTMVGLESTSTITKEAKRFVHKPRCGKPDNHKNDMRAFATKHKPWNKRLLTYRFRNYPLNHLGMDVAIEEIGRAFKLWSEQANIDFKLVEREDPDIWIQFFPANQGDGAGGTLAYAYFPNNGDAYFDAEEWTTGSKRGINLFMVAAHEFGHSIGLDHSKVKNALMYNYYSEYQEDFKLHPDDIQRVQQLYGAKDTCALDNIDDIIQISGKIFYVLKNNECWKFVNERLEKGYPKSIISEWPLYYYRFQPKSLFSVLTANLENSGAEKAMKKVATFVMDGHIFLFRGDICWKRNIEGGKTSAEAKISDVWAGVPSSIDAVYYDGKKYIYFFKGNQFYKFDKRRDNDRRYSASAHPISEWFGCKK